MGFVLPKWLFEKVKPKIGPSSPLPKPTYSPSVSPSVSPSLSPSEPWAPPLSEDDDDFSYSISPSAEPPSGVDFADYINLKKVLNKPPKLIETPEDREKREKLNTRDYKRIVET